MTEIDANKKHQRFGYIPQDQFCDAVIDRATELVPGDGVLPPRWRYGSRDQFLSKYKERGQTLWAKTASYHLLLSNGEYILRIWTDTPDRCIVDLHDVLSQMVTLPVSECPKSVLKKTHPLTKRVVVTQLSGIEELMELVMLVWPG